MSEAQRVLVALLLCALTACSGGRGLRPVLSEFRAVAPRQQVVEPAWLATFTTDELYGRLSPDGRRLSFSRSPWGRVASSPPLTPSLPSPSSCPARRRRGCACPRDSIRSTA